MSRGPGTVEKRIADLLALTRDRALSVDEIADHAFALRGARPTRAQRLSATRAAHRVLCRVRDAKNMHQKLVNQAHANTEAALGRKQSDKGADEEYQNRLKDDPAWAQAEVPYSFCNRIEPSRLRSAVAGLSVIALDA